MWGVFENTKTPCRLLVHETVILANGLWAGILHSLPPGRRIPLTFLKFKGGPRVALTLVPSETFLPKGGAAGWRAVPQPVGHSGLAGAGISRLVARRTPLSGDSDLTARRGINPIALRFFLLYKILGMFAFVAGEAWALSVLCVERMISEQIAGNFEGASEDLRISVPTKCTTGEKGHLLHF